MQTRFYDPTVRRFLNADSLFIAGDVLTGTSMYAYCNGNPVMYSDPSGRESESSINWLVGLVACIAIAEAIVRFLPEVLWEPLAEAAGKALGQFTTPDSIVNAARTIIGNIAWLGDKISQASRITGLTLNQIGFFILTGIRMVGDVLRSGSTIPIGDAITGRTVEELEDYISQTKATVIVMDVLSLFGGIAGGLLALGTGLVVDSSWIKPMEDILNNTIAAFGQVSALFKSWGLIVPIKDWVEFLLR